MLCHLWSVVFVLFWLVPADAANTCRLWWGGYWEIHDSWSSSTVNNNLEAKKLVICISLYFRVFFLAETCSTSETQSSTVVIQQLYLMRLNCSTPGEVMQAGGPINYYRLPPSCSLDFQEKKDTRGFAGVCWECVASDAGEIMKSDPGRQMWVKDPWVWRPHQLIVGISQFQSWIDIL